MPDLDSIADDNKGGMEVVLRRIAYSAIRSYERDDVVRLPDSAGDDVAKELAKIWSNATVWQGGEMVEEFRSYGFQHLETKNDEKTLFDQIVDQFLEIYGAQKVAQILKTSRDEIMRMIKVGVDEGLSSAQIAKNMREAVQDLSAVRALTIARTETHGASGYARQQVAKQSRRPLNKTWNSVEDHRTRAIAEGDTYGHRSMDGVTVKMSEPYFVPTKYGTREPLMFPGDPNGSAGNVINCRCVETYSRAERDSG